MTSDSDLEVARFLMAARQRLEFVEQGYRDYLEGGERRPSGIYNVPSAGRAFTQALQRLRGKADGFEDWYRPFQQQMAADPVFKWFWQLRNKLEKQGEPTGDGVTKSEVSFVGGLPRVGPGERLVLGSDHGRNYRLIPLADGSTQTVYVDMPPEMVKSQYILEGAPDDRDFGDLAAEYISGLKRILAAAEERWGS